MWWGVVGCGEGVVAWKGSNSDCALSSPQPARASAGRGGGVRVGPGCGEGVVGVCGEGVVVWWCDKGVVWK